VATLLDRRAEGEIALQPGARPFGRRMWRQAMRWTIRVHRWLGIGACLLFLIWFVSGLVLVYVLPPRLTAAELHAGLPPLAVGEVEVPPQAVLSGAGLDEFPRELRLEQAPSGPVYRITPWEGERIAFSAVTGLRVRGVSEDEARASAEHFAGALATGAQRVERDQWTWGTAFDAHRPFWRVSMDDEAGTRVYVSAQTGAIVLDATAAERFWSWIGYVPHLLDLEGVRGNEGLWRPLFLWTLGPSLVLAATGLWLGIVRLRVRRRFRNGSVSPYRGWMKWHHLTGIIGGMVLFGWTLSAFIYLRPGDYLKRVEPGREELSAYAGAPGPTFPAAPQAIRAFAPPDTRVIRFTWVGGQPLIVFTDAARREVAVQPDGRAARLHPQWLAERSRALAGGAPIAWLRRLEAPDEYWHTFRNTERRLPALRVAYADPRESWAYLDPATGEMLSWTNADSRLFRWLFNGLHKFDFLPLVRPGFARDLVVVPLLVLGILTSLSGIVLGWRRLRRSGQRHA
jgi:hypothetical protein